jgi:UDP-N-acetylmuramoyl-tripeptide--D-alanyl-D-alanine ligase
MSSTTVNFLGDLDVRRALDPISAPALEALKSSLAGADEVVVSLSNMFGEVEDDQAQSDLSIDQITAVAVSLGVSVVALGSKAAMEGGVERMMALIDSLRAAGIAAVGAGENEAAARMPHRIALGNDEGAPNLYLLPMLRSAAHETLLSYLARPDRPGVASARTKPVLESVKSIRYEDPGAIIAVLPDWSGLAMQGQLNRARRWSLRAIGAGADYVLGHGSPQRMRTIQQGEGADVHTLGQALPGPDERAGRMARFRWLPSVHGVGESAMSINLLRTLSDAPGGAVQVQRRLVQRRVRDLLSLEHLGRVEYYGDVTCPLNGIEYRNGRARLAGKFYLLMGNDWNRGSRQRAGQLDLSLAELVERGKQVGVLGFVVDREQYDAEILAGQNVIVVDGTRDFFRLAAAGLRKKMAGKLIGITGTAGKSSTQGIVQHLLQAVMPQGDIFAPPGNQNLYHNHQAFLTATSGRDATVIEMAVSAATPQQVQGFRISPDVAIVTNIGESHLESLGTVERVAQQKSVLLERLPKGATVLMSADIAYREVLEEKLAPQGITPVTYGESENADIRLVEIDSSSNTMRVSFGGREAVVSTGGQGTHLLHNSLAALGTVDALGHDWVEAAQHIGSFQPIRGRGRIYEIESDKRFTVIDESYNANPSSMRAALETLLQRSQQRRVAVLGDMLEMGEQSGELHAKLIEHVSNLSLAKVYLIGPIMAGYADRLPAGMLAGVYNDAEGLAERLQGELEDGDAIMFKASNGIGLGNVVSEMTASA